MRGARHCFGDVVAPEQVKTLKPSASKRARGERSTDMDANLLRETL